MTNLFECAICSDVDYDALIAELIYDGELCVIISQDNGPDALDAKIFARKTGESWRFKLSDFEEAIAAAKEKLLSPQKKSAGQ